jgi:hypothetical protein
MRHVPLPQRSTFGRFLGNVAAFVLVAFLLLLAADWLWSWVGAPFLTCTASAWLFPALAALPYVLAFMAIVWWVVSGRRFAPSLLLVVAFVSPAAPDAAFELLGRFCA